MIREYSAKALLDVSFRFTNSLAVQVKNVYHLSIASVQIKCHVLL